MEPETGDEGNRESASGYPSSGSLEAAFGDACTSGNSEPVRAAHTSVHRLQLTHKCVNTPREGAGRPRNALARWRASARGPASHFIRFPISRLLLVEI